MGCESVMMQCCCCCCCAWAVALKHASGNAGMRASAAGTHPHTGPDFVPCGPQLLHNPPASLAC